MSRAAIMGAGTLMRVFKQVFDVLVSLLPLLGMRPPLIRSIPIKKICVNKNSNINININIHFLNQLPDPIQKQFHRITNHNFKLLQLLKQKQASGIIKIIHQIKIFNFMSYVKTTILRKFEFKDLNLAYKVRGNMLKALIQFDANKNQLFDTEEIKDALVSILGEDENQVHYVVKNVFRYDRDGDGSITYPELTNFSVEQHFGQMAIQRLHKKGYYTNGARRVMNLEQFEATLNYCLNFINSAGTHAEYERLFNQVDLDQDGFISYQDYFIFLREYFGSQSKAFSDEEQGKKPPAPQPPVVEPVKPVVPPTNFTDGNGETPQQRFAKLIYSQFKITIMERDKNKNLLLERSEVEDILANVLRLNYNQQMQLEEKIMGGSNTVKYEDFMRISITTYMSVITAQKNFSGQTLNENQFVELVNKICNFVAVKPAEHVIKACFKAGSRSSSLSQSDYTSMMKGIFQNFKFDNRGLPNTRPKSQRFNSIAPQSYY